MVRAPVAVTLRWLILGALAIRAVERQVDRTVRRLTSQVHLP